MRIVRVEVITDGVRADALAPLWDNLVERSGARAWVAPAWMLGWWRTHRPSAPLCVVAVFEGEDLMAVGPFFQVGPPGLRLVRFLGQINQPNSIVCVPGSDGPVAAVWDALRRRGSALDLFDIEDRAGSGYGRLADDPRWRLFDEPADSCINIPIAGSADDYFRDRSGIAAGIRRRRRMLERDRHILSVVDAQTADEIALLLPEVASLAALAQRERFKPGDLEELARARLPGTVTAMANANRVHVTLLRVDERPAAFALDLIGGGVVHSHLSSYDTQLKRYSPGELCLEEAFRWAVAHGAREFDLGVGASANKRRWSDDEYFTRRVVAAPSSAELALARAGMSLRARVDGLRSRISGRGDRDSVTITE
jgi:CelD/BcsL family acetyltransferase involved in cellulose biosynthesis